MTDITATPDLAAIKQRQQATWASGDYHMVGTQILIVSECSSKRSTNIRPNGSSMSTGQAYLARRFEETA